MTAGGLKRRQGVDAASPTYFTGSERTLDILGAYAEGLFRLWKAVGEEKHSEQVSTSQRTRGR